MIDHIDNLLEKNKNNEKRYKLQDCEAFRNEIKIL